MKHIRNFLIVFFLLATEYSLADNTHIGDITIQQGENKELSIVLQNTEHEYTAFQMDLNIPEGITVSRTAKGEAEISLDTNRTQDHTFSVVEIESGKYRLLAYSISNNPFKGTSGTLVSIIIKTDAQTSDGNYIVSVQNQRFTDKLGQKYFFDDIQATVTVQEPLLTITANSYSRFYGDENPSFEYTTDGTTLIGTPQIVCEATPSSPVGDYPIRVKTGSVTNGNVTFVDGVLTIKKSPLAIVADSKTKKQGEQMPEFTATYLGFKNEENISVLSTSPQFSCNADESSAPGSYDIEVYGAEAANYDISYRKGTLTVTQADAIVVTVKNYTRKYGDSNPSQFEYTVEGGSLSGVPSITCVAVPTSPVGNYDIIIAKGTVTNYNVTFVKGALTVEKANLSIKADSKDMLIGSQLPELTATYQGFKNDETPSVLTKMPEFQCSATSQSLAGSYTISVLGAEAQNYDFTYENGQLTVVDPPLRVKVNNVEREYGEQNPTFEYAVEGGTLIGQPAFTCEATISSHVGNYDIIIGKGTVLNANVTYENGVMTIVKAPLDIKADDKTVMQGEELPSFTATYDGFKLNDDESSLKKAPVFSCEAVSSTQLGEYPITVTGAESDDYDIAYCNGVLRVIEPEITVRVVNMSRTFGDENPSFEYIVEGGTLQGEPVLRCEATPYSKVGEYVIIIEKGGVTNNSVTFVNGILSVEKAPLTITADNKRIVFGDEMPLFTATYSGFKNDDTPAILDSEPRFTCSATSNSNPGDYTIEASGAQARNYDIDYISGVLTIEQPSPVIAEISNLVAGQLSAQLEQGGFVPLSVNELKVNGLLNGTDIKCIREMIIYGNLTELDILNTSIVSGGESYYGEGIMEQHTENNVIGQFMFYNCKNLISIKLPNTVKLIKFAFDGCDNLLRLDIPESCEEIGSNAISSCSSLTTIRIPAATKSFDSYNILFCPSLTSIEVDPANPWLEAVDGVLFLKDKSTLVKYPMGKNATIYQVPDEVKTIGDWAFSDAILSQIDLPEGLVEIGNDAFYDCECLTVIKFPSTLRLIGRSAFGWCDKIESLSFPEGVTDIPSFVASFCKELQRIDLPSTIESIDSYAFSNCHNLSEIYCHFEDMTKVSFSTDYYTGIANAFNEIHDKCIWHVVEGTSYKYTKEFLPWWVESWIVIDDIPSGIASPTIALQRIYSDNGILYIESDADYNFNIYTTSGHLVRRLALKKGKNAVSDLVKGVYVINRQKIIVK